MPYKDKVKDREWHRDVMRKRRAKLKLEGSIVTPEVTPKVDADGNVIYER